MAHFTKPALSIERQLQLLKDRGLQVADDERAKRYLRNIGYYRLGGYCLKLRAAGPDHKFLPGTSFDDILNLYIFDRKLRLLTIDAMERVEIALRTSIINECCQEYDSHWYMYPDVFDDEIEHAKFIKCVKKLTFFNKRGRGSVVFEHYYSKYTYPRLPSAWMIADVVPLGSWSKVFSNLNDVKIKKNIAKRFNLAYPDLASWLQALSFIRNVCAHHSKLWDRIFTKKPAQIKRLVYHLSPNTTYYAYAAMIQDLLSSFTHHSTWSKRLYGLMLESPLDPATYMGFKPKWHEDPFWKITPPSPSSP